MTIYRWLIVLFLIAGGLSVWLGYHGLPVPCMVVGLCDMFLGFLLAGFAREE